MFTHAIVRKPGKNFCEGITTAGLGPPDYETALQQHAAYCNALEKCGVELSVLDADLRYPDAWFVEDTAVVTETCAIITRMREPTRQGEQEAVRDVLSCFRTLEQLVAPAHLDGGDVLRVGDHFYIGLSGRTNAEGARQLSSILVKHGYTASTVPVSGMLHLKTGATFIDPNTLLAIEPLVNRQEFEAFDRIAVDEDEDYSANSLAVNGTILTPMDYPRTKAKLQQSGAQVLELDTSEFRKMDGGLTCLSLLF